MTISRRPLLASLLAAPALATGRAARAQPAPTAATWPDRPIRLVVPFGPGGAIDTLSRSVGQRFSDLTGQPLVIENRAGAGGTIAGAYVASLKPDGLTLMMADIGANAVGKEIYPGLSYDPGNAFTPIIHLVNLPLALIARPNLPVRDLADLIAQAKAKPNGFTYSSAGAGNASQLVMELMLKQVGAKMVHVPYKSGAEAVTALVRGDVDLSFPSLSSGLGTIRGGQVKTLGIATPGGSPVLPEVPAISDTVPGFSVSIWHGILAPAGLDPALAQKINTIFQQVIDTPAVRDAAIRNQGAIIVGGAPEVFAKHIASEIARWTPVIREGGFRAD
jgi:tripartite-type tricarboxylate transporter receptor subunit TctC